MRIAFCGIPKIGKTKLIDSFLNNWKNYKKSDYNKVHKLIKLKEVLVVPPLAISTLIPFIDIAPDAGNVIMLPLQAVTKAMAMEQVVGLFDSQSETR